MSGLCLCQSDRPTELMETGVNLTKRIETGISPDQQALIGTGSVTTRELIGTGIRLDRYTKTHWTGNQLTEYRTHWNWISLTRHYRKTRCTGIRLTDIRTHWNWNQPDRHTELVGTRISLTDIQNSLELGSV